MPAHAFSSGDRSARWRHQFNAYPPPPQPDTKRIHPLILVVVNAFLVVVSLAALFGIWFGRTGGTGA